MVQSWGEVVVQLARLVDRGDVGAVRRAILGELERRIPFAGASFHTFGPDACADRATATVGNGRELLERVTSVWAQQLTELEGMPLASVAELGVARLDDVRWKNGTGRDTRTWKEVFEAVGVGDTLNVFIRVPAGPPRLLVLIRNGAEQLGLSANTVRNQLSDVYERCGVTNRTELVALAARYGDDLTPTV